MAEFLKMVKIDSDNITSLSAYGTSFFGTIYGLIQKIDWLTVISVLLSLVVALTNFWYQRRKVITEIRKIEQEINIKKREAEISLAFLAEKNKLELERLERNLQ